MDELGFPFWLRAAHFINLFCMFLLIRSGIQIEVALNFFSDGRSRESDMGPPFSQKSAVGPCQEAGGRCVWSRDYTLNALEERVNWGLCWRGKGVG